MPNRQIFSKPNFQDSKKKIFITMKLKTQFSFLLFENAIK